MNIEQLLADFRYEDLQWVVPVLAGLVVVVGGLLIGIVRGMSAGVVVALLFGGLLSLSPVMLDALQRNGERVAPVTADVARGAAELAVLNNDVLSELARVLTTLRTVMNSVTATGRSASEGEGVTLQTDEERIALMTGSLTRTKEQIDAAISTLARANLLRQRLEEDMQSLEVEVRRPAAGGTR